MPRSDVAGGGLTMLLAAVLGQIFDRSIPFDFQVWDALIAALITIGLGYWSSKYKPLVMAVAAPVASLVTAAIAGLIFNQPIAPAFLSGLVATILGVILTYRIPPFDASPLDVDAVGPGGRWSRSQ